MFAGDAVAAVHRAAASGRPGTPQHRRRHDRRPDDRVDAGDAQGATAADRPRHQLHPQLRQQPGLLPLPRHLPDRAVLAQQRGASQQPAERRDRGARRLRDPAGRAAARRLLHRPHRQVPERLRAANGARPGSRPDGTRGRDRSTAPPTGCSATPSTRTARWSPTGTTTSRTPPTTRPTSTRRRRSALIERRAPQAAAVLPQRRAAGAARRDLPAASRPATTTRAIPTFPNPRPAPRHAGAFDGEKLPQRASFNEADVSDKPAAIAALTPISQQARGVLRARYRSRLASLLAVDDLVGRVVACAPRHRRARRHADRLHLRQRLPARRAPDPDRQAVPLRGVDRRAADPARSRRPAGRGAPRSSPPTSTWPRRSSTTRTPSPPRPPTAAPCAP